MQVGTIKNCLKIRVILINMGSAYHVLATL
jgi:hypothetical protein